MPINLAVLTKPFPKSEIRQRKGRLAVGGDLDHFPGGGAESEDGPAGVQIQRGDELARLAGPHGTPGHGHGP